VVRWLSSALALSIAPMAKAHRAYFAIVGLWTFKTNTSVCN
jgi:hypothetical protein